MKILQKRNLPRFILQWGVIAFLLFLGAKAYFFKEFTPNFEAYCPFGGLQAISSYLLNNSLACSMTTIQIAMGIMLIIGIILFSKLFCAYICPIGTISEWLGSIGDKFKIRVKITGLTDKILRSLKYILLFITFYFTLDSNELFCKKFDPYYAIASGFSIDVVWFYAVLSITIVVIGSIIFRLFWCKYLCPLGAISNIIKFTWFFAAVVLIYVILLKAGIQLSYVWPLGIAAIGGYILEIWGEKLNFFPVAKITRNESTCTNCQLCSRKCPQVIDVAKMRVVTAADCNLCGECLEVCPEKETLLINNKSGMKWLPPKAAIVLFILGLTLSSNWELPTIDQRWGTAEEIEKGAVFTQSGISAIKCFGSSMAFAAQMKQVKGVYGVATFVSTHKVKVYYDPAILNDVKIQAELFTPQKSEIQALTDGLQSVKMVSGLLDNFFDPSDFANLTLLLKEKSDALGVESEFSCPVTVRIYLPGNSTLSENSLKDILETKVLAVTTVGQSSKLSLSFKLASPLTFKSIALKDYKYKMFDAYENSFNGKSNYREAILDTLVVPSEHKTYNLNAVSYFVSHLSNDNGIVGFKSSMDSTSQIYFNIIYVDSLTNRDKIFKSMKSDTLTINYEGGEVGKVVNKFKF
ncbi:MAG: 4Fe-4S binding protein [Prolixibacteraceae bacterium]